jgi:hypothetical protein
MVAAARIAAVEADRTVEAVEEAVTAAVVTVKA